jgi:hypothetical protein
MASAVPRDRNSRAGDHAAKRIAVSDLDALRMLERATDLMVDGAAVIV